MSAIPAQIDAMIQQLRGFANLDSDWDAHGARHTAPDAINLAINLVYRIASDFGVVPDFIAPLANGGVQLEWNDESIEIEIEVHPKGEFNYLLKGASRVERHGVSLSGVLDVFHGR